MTHSTGRLGRRSFLAAATLATAWPVHAGALRERIAERHAARRAEDDNTQHGGQGPLPPGVRVLRDMAYGGDAAQRFDVYLPPQMPPRAPVLFMVHGGGWRRGDKAMAKVVAHKVARWVPRGFVFVSINYPLLPVPPIDQARAVAEALAEAQAQAVRWGADRGRFVLMGHSAGAHLIALLGAAPELGAGAAVTPWLGSVLLDSAAYDVPQLMRTRHPRLFDHAFGDDPQVWRAASPHHRLRERMAPLLAVCGTSRADACARADAFAAKARSFGGRASVSRQDLSHGDINGQLGLPGAYTAAVEDFLRTLDESVAARLA